MVSPPSLCCRRVGRTWMSVVDRRSSVVGAEAEAEAEASLPIPAPSPTAGGIATLQCRSAPASESNLSSPPRLPQQPWSNERGKPFLPVPRAPTPPALPRQPQLGVGHHRLRVPRLHSRRPLSSFLLLRRVLRPLLSAVIPHPCLPSSLPLLTFLLHPRTPLRLVPLSPRSLLRLGPTLASSPFYSDFDLASSGVCERGRSEERECVGLGRKEARRNGAVVATALLEANRINVSRIIHA